MRGQRTKLGRFLIVSTRCAGATTTTTTSTTTNFLLMSTVLLFSILLFNCYIEMHSQQKHRKFLVLILIPGFLLLLRALYASIVNIFFPLMSFLYKSNFLEFSRFPFFVSHSINFVSFSFGLIYIQAPFCKLVRNRAFDEIYSTFLCRCPCDIIRILGFDFKTDVFC